MAGRIGINWVQHSEHHYQTEIAGLKLDAWPKTRKWRFKGVTYTERSPHGSFDKAVLDRLAEMGEGLPPLKKKKVKKRGTAAYCRNCRHWDRGLGGAQKDVDPWGYCNKLPPPPDDEIMITEENATCSQFSARQGVRYAQEVADAED